MRILFLLFSVALFYSFSHEGEEKTALLYLEIEGIERVEGNIGILIFNTQSGFPKSAEQAYRELEVKVTSRNMKIALQDMPYGNYAFSILQDINENKKMDFNLIGIPKEPYGFSNDQSRLTGLPNFEEATIIFKEDKQSTRIKLVCFY